MTGVTIRITGLDETNNMLKQVKRALFDFEVDQALMQGALCIEGEAKRKCPVDTGRLRDSITSEITDSNGNEHKAWVGTNVEYAQYVEYGTGLSGENNRAWASNTLSIGGITGGKICTGMTARPFLRPALDARRADAINAIREYILQKYGGGA